MLNIAKKLIALVIVMVLGVMVFIWYRSSQPPALLGLIPQQVKEAGFIDVRNLMKKAYSQGVTDLGELTYPDFLHQVFSVSNNAKEPGINLYSELVWFKHQEGYNCIFVRLANTERWEAYLRKYKEEAQLEDIQSQDDIKYVRFKNYNALFAWRGKHLALLYDSANAEILSFSQAFDVLKPKSKSEILNKAYEKTTPDVFYVDLVNNNTLAIKLLNGKVRYVWNENVKNLNEFAPFSSIDAQEQIAGADTSVTYMSADFALQQVNFVTEEQLKSKHYAGVAIYSYHSIGVDSIMSSIKYLDKIPNQIHGFAIKNPAKTLLFQDSYSKHIVDADTNNIRIFKTKEQLTIGTQEIGTIYFLKSNQLLFKEVAEYIMSNKMFGNVQDKKN